MFEYTRHNPLSCTAHITSSVYFYSRHDNDTQVSGHCIALLRYLLSNTYNSFVLLTTPSVGGCVCQGAVRGDRALLRPRLGRLERGSYLP